MNQLQGEDLHRKLLSRDEQKRRAQRQPSRDEIQLRKEIEAKLASKETNMKSELRKLEEKIKEKTKQLRQSVNGGANAKPKQLTAKERREQLLNKDYQKYKDKTIEDIVEEGKLYFFKDDSKWYR